MFSCEFCEISKNTFFTEHIRTIASVYDNDYQSEVYHENMRLFITCKMLKRVAEKYRFTVLFTQTRKLGSELTILIITLNKIKAWFKKVGKDKVFCM